MATIKTKPWYKSKAVWGGLVTIFVAIGGMMTESMDIPTGMAQVAAGVLAVYGRLVAKSPIEE